ncbi:MAG: hypothetical protein LQ340_005469 [Diploschistes diacapsis]|nr:MAG: hypothetical protein LQ340_005469 [Diploschistes diacapsis]
MISSTSTSPTSKPTLSSATSTTSKTLTPASSSSTSPRVRQQQYLLIYNLASAILWFSVLVRVLVLIPLVGYQNVYGGVGDFARWVQTGALLEIVHAALGLVRSPISTTAIQVSSRLILVHAIVHPFPAHNTTSPFYASMLLAWSATEVIRYSYFVQTIRGADPGVLTWLRYNTFYVLYPVGIASEMANIWLATRDSGMGEWEVVGCWGLLGFYVPGRFGFCLRYSFRGHGRGG